MLGVGEHYHIGKKLGDGPPRIFVADYFLGFFWGNSITIRPQVIQFHFHIEYKVIFCYTCYKFQQIHNNVATK